MDARSIAATAANGGILTPATDLVDEANIPGYKFDDSAYRSRVYQGFQKADDELDLVYGPNIKDWPAMSALADNILLKVCSKILDEVTTTDELIPSGETSAFRSNPLKLAEFALSRRDPEYVGNTKAVDKVEKARLEGQDPVALDPKLADVYAKITEKFGIDDVKDIEIGSMIYAKKPGDGSAREQAASCQRVMGDRKSVV